MASQLASNIAGSNAFILSARVRATWAMFADISIETLSEFLSENLSEISSDIGRSSLSNGGLGIL